jgi:hypothetical protein
MTIYNVTPSSNLQNVVAGLHQGDTVDFGSGTYDISSTINLQSGISFISTAGAILDSTSSNNIMEGDDVSNVTIKGLTFENGPNLFGSGDTHAAVLLVDSNNASITNNAFENIHADAAVFFYESDNINVNNNTGSNLTQFVSGVNNIGNHGNISISGNTLSGISRTAIEMQGDYSNLHVNSNTITDNGGTANEDGADAISIVNGSAAVSDTTNVTASGNHINGGNNGIEAAVSNITVASNTLTNLIGGISIGEAPGSDFYGNLISNVSIPLGEDGGYTGNQITIGANTINGISVTGWPSGSDGSGSGSGSGSGGGSGHHHSHH